MNPYYDDGTCTIPVRCLRLHTGESGQRHRGAHRAMTMDDDAPFCTCGHSLYDHAIEGGARYGECFVGGCNCSRWQRNDELPRKF